MGWSASITFPFIFPLARLLNRMRVCVCVCTCCLHSEPVLSFDAGCFYWSSSLPVDRRRASALCLSPIANRITKEVCVCVWICSLHPKGEVGVEGPLLPPPRGGISMQRNRNINQSACGLSRALYQYQPVEPQTLKINVPAIRRE